MPTWNLKNICNPSEKDLMIESLKNKVEDFNNLRNKLNAELKPEEFMDIIRQKEEITEISNKLGGYYGLKLMENTSNHESNALNDRISEIITHADNNILFFTLWFKDLSDEDAKKFIDNSGKYRYFLERIRAFKKYSLKEKEEQILNFKSLTSSEASNKFYDIITNRFKFNLDGKEVSQEEINSLKSSHDRNRRVLAYNLLFEKYKEDQAIIGEIYKNLVNDWKNENIVLRRFPSPISVRNHANDIADEAVASLLNVVRKNVSLFNEYFRLKSKLLNLENFDRYDLYSPYSSEEKEFTYQEAKDITLETYKEFDIKAYEMAREIFDNTHVHSDITDNKQSGAFCWTVTKDITPYILLNFTNKLKDIFTMAHEFGHGIHSISARNQTQFTFHSALPMAETASIFGEMLLSKKLLKEADKKEKIDILVRNLDSQYASIIRQAYFVLFEMEAHKRIAEGATIKDLNEIYMENLKEQFGNIPIPDIFQYEWNYIPHIHHAPFYCYSYAFGNLLVLALYGMYEKEGKEFVPKYMKILSYGGSESPFNVLKEVGIDIAKEDFWQQGFDIIKEELEELKALINI